MDVPGRLNVVDSSAWLACFSGEPTAEDFEPAIEALDQLVVPAVCVFEVFKVVARSRSAQDADLDGLPDVRFVPKWGVR